MLSPKEIAVHYVKTGNVKTKTVWYRLLLLGIMAGAFIALAAVGANTASCMIQNPGVSRLISAFIFPAGLVMVILAGAELFTGNCLLVISVLAGEASIKDLLKCWLFVYSGNFIGAVFIAWLVNAGNQLSLFDGELAVATIRMAASKSVISFGSAVILGSLCNFLVCIAVWIGCAGKTISEKIIGIYLPIMLFVISGFEHSVANMYYIPAGMIAKGNPTYASMLGERGIDAASLSLRNFLAGNLLPVTLGNIIGGAVFVGAVYWALYIKDGTPETGRADHDN